MATGPIQEQVAPAATLETSDGRSLRKTTWDQLFWALMIGEFQYSPLRKAGDAILKGNTP